MPKPVRIDAISDNLMGAAYEERFGIEIEVEGVNPRNFPAAFRFWNVTEDGSLRGVAREFQSRPLPRESFDMALAEIYRPKPFWSPSVRTGIHVHVNMLQRTLDDVKNLYLYYLYTEPLFYRLCGDEREHNIYCVPLYRQPDEVTRVWGYLKDRTQLRNNAGRMCKYVGLYMEPLKRFGTIEFRMAPTWPQVETTAKWLETIDRLTAESSVTARVHPHKLYAEAGVQGMVDAIWPDWRERFNITPAELKVIYNRTQADEVALSTQEPGPIETPWGRPGTYEADGTPMAEPDEAEKVNYLNVFEIAHWLARGDEPQPKKKAPRGLTPNQVYTIAREAQDRVQPRRAQFVGFDEALAMPPAQMYRLDHRGNAVPIPQPPMLTPGPDPTPEDFGMDDDDDHDFTEENE